MSPASEFRIMSITNEKGSRAGVTLVELMVGMGIAGLVMLIIAPLSLYSGRSFAEIANYSDLNCRSINALDRLTKEIRQSSGLLSYSSTEITITNGPGKPNIAYAYLPASREVVRREGATTTVLLRQCDSVDFRMYQRTPKPGGHEQYETSDPGSCKVITVKWVCSRKMLGARRNTDEVQTARVVIRKH
jgi:type II secretory pathway pseudopilin PulG